LFAFYSIMQ